MSAGPIGSLVRRKDVRCVHERFAAPAGIRPVSDPLQCEDVDCGRIAVTFQVLCCRAVIVGISLPANREAAVFEVPSADPNRFRQDRRLGSGYPENASCQNSPPDLPGQDYSP